MSTHKFEIVVSIESQSLDCAQAWMAWMETNWNNIVREISNYCGSEILPKKVSISKPIPLE